MQEIATVKYVTLGDEQIPFLVIDGCTVYFGRNDETGQLHVRLCTEDYEYGNDNLYNGSPVAQLEVNDATVYDVELTAGEGGRHFVPEVGMIDRLKADLSYHQDEAARITREELDIDTAPDGAYSIESDCAESYHTGRVEALTNAIDLLIGRKVELYSEKEAGA
jgi:hypothetical protein